VSLTSESASDSGILIHLKSLYFFCFFCEWIIKELRSFIY
jgi:hypothetical protein